MVIFPWIKQENFRVVLDTFDYPIFHLFWQNSPPSNLQKHQKRYRASFGQISNSSLIFYCLPFYYAPRLVNIEVTFKVMEEKP